MPITFVEDNSSRSATISRLGRKAASSMKRCYKLFGSSDDLEVHAYVNSVVASQLLFWDYPGSTDQRLQAENYTLSYLGDDAWQLEVSYTKEGAADDPNEPEPLRRSRAFDTAGGSTHITQAQGTPPERRYPSSGEDAAPDQKGVIGVDGSSVQGVDIVIPALSWTETYDVPSTYVSINYFKNLSRMTGTVNQEAFRGFAPREVLFMGSSGSQDWNEKKGDGPWTLSYKFVASSNAGENKDIPALTIGDIEGIEKDGHEYLWVRYEDKVEDESLVKVPKYVYVDKVYRETSFAALGIGVA